MGKTADQVSAEQRIVQPILPKQGERRGKVIID
jgi:hypothetical protein